MSVKLSAARKRAVVVLARAPERRARESNITASALGSGASAHPTIYWQSRAWLSQQGLIVESSPPSGYRGTWRYGWYELTPKGDDLARSLGLLP